MFSYYFYWLLTELLTHPKTVLFPSTGLEAKEVLVVLIHVTGWPIFCTVQIWNSSCIIAGIKDQSGAAEAWALRLRYVILGEFDVKFEIYFAFCLRFVVSESRRELGRRRAEPQGSPLGEAGASQVVSEFRLSISVVYPRLDVQDAGLWVWFEILVILAGCLDLIGTRWNVEDDIVLRRGVCDAPKE